MSETDLPEILQILIGIFAFILIPLGLSITFFFLSKGRFWLANANHLNKRSEAVEEIKRELYDELLEETS